MGRPETNKAGVGTEDVRQCCNCRHEKMFHGNGACYPLALREKDGTICIIRGDFKDCACKEFDNRFIRVMGDERRFHSVKEAREAGAI